MRIVRWFISLWGNIFKNYLVFISLIFVCLWMRFMRFTILDSGQQVVHWFDYMIGVGLFLMLKYSSSRMTNLNFLVLYFQIWQPGKITGSNFRWRRCGSPLLGLRLLDPPLSPPSTPEEMCLGGGVKICWPPKMFNPQKFVSPIKFVDPQKCLTPKNLWAP